VGPEPAPPGTLVEILTERGEIAGCYILEEPGLLKMIHIYGADGPSGIGFSEGETLYYRINSEEVPGDQILTWADDRLPHEVTLQTQTGRVKIYLPLVIR